MRGRHSSFEGDPKGGGARGPGHAGEVRSRRDAKRRARGRAQLNNGLPYPPSPLTRALCLFVLSSSSLSLSLSLPLSPSSLPSPSPSLLLLSDPHPHALLPSSPLVRLPTYLLPTYLTTITVYLLSLVSSTLRPISHLEMTRCWQIAKRERRAAKKAERPLLSSCFRGLRARVTST